MHEGVQTFLQNNPTFDFRSSQISSHQHEDALKNIPPEDVSGVVKSLGQIQRVQALTAEPSSIPTLLKAGVPSAHAVAQMPRSKFVELFKDHIEDSLASEIHDHASQIALRNDATLLEIYNIIQGAGLAAIDGKENIDTRMAAFRKAADGKNLEINLEDLFGGMDYCDCDDCSSVLSPANYYVELLQYLRNNMLDPDKENGVPKFPNTYDAKYNKTALDVLLRRRPDLAHLQLTCENANTLIPYVDLANEVMESFVVHQKDKPIKFSPAAQYTLDVFNVSDETSSELLAEPQHTNYRAYCILLNAVYPLGSLPFHQPLAAIRIYLNFLQTSRYEVMNIFEEPYATPAQGGPYSKSDNEKLSKIYDETALRAQSAEYLSICQEEYLILTKEAFWPKSYFETTMHKSLSDAEYQKDIGVRATRDYWGYATDKELNSTDTATMEGLEFVKRQFLRRSGLDYPDVVDLIKTSYVNPVFPTGNDLLIFENLHFSYRFLQSLVHDDKKTKKEKYATLIAFLEVYQPLADAWIAKHQGESGGGASSSISTACICYCDIAKFVYKWFDCLGKLIVLESGECPTLPVHGRIVKITTPPPPPAPKLMVASEDSTPDDEAGILPEGATIIGTLYTDGTMTDNKTDDGTGTPRGKVIGSIQIDSRAYKPSGELLGKGEAEYTTFYIALVKKTIRGPLYSYTAEINAKDSVLRWVDEGEVNIVRWNAVVDSCDISTVRIVHLNGNPLQLDEWDRIQRFIRLQKRTGWTMDETDKAVSGLSMEPNGTDTQPPPPKPPIPDNEKVVTWGDFKNSCSDSMPDPSKKGSSDCGCGKGQKCGCCDWEDIPDACASAKRPNITADFINQLASVVRLQTLTSIELIQLLSLWADISTAGSNSLYSQLFLTHNLVGVDPVFVPDADGNYLNPPTKIQDHVPVIMAAFRLTTSALTSIINDADLNEADLTLDSITLIYRYALLSQNLAVSPEILIQASKLFEYQYKTADATQTVDFVTAVEAITNSPFTIPELAYIINGDDPTNTLTPTEVQILQTTSTLSQGLISILTTYPNPKIDPKNPPTDEALNKLLNLLYAPDLMAKIIALLDGTTVYTTNAPLGLSITVPAELKAKLKYSETNIPGSAAKRGVLTVMGLLTDEEKTRAKNISAVSGWAAAVDRIGKQAIDFFNTYLSPIFAADLAKARTTLLAGDSKITPPLKRSFFLVDFVPYLRAQLSRKLIISTMSDAVGLTSLDVATMLITETITLPGKDGHNQSIMDILINLTNTVLAAGSAWTGYLIPPTTDTYTFIGFGDKKPADLTIDGVAIPFVRQQADPNDVWFTDPTPLAGGRLYKFNAGGQTVPGIEWATATTLQATIPSSALLPDAGSNLVQEVFTKLQKAALLVEGFNLVIEQIKFFQSASALKDFGFNLNKPTYKGFQRLLAYFNLQSSVSQTTSNLIKLFTWATKNATSSVAPSVYEIALQISNATQWAIPDIVALISKDGWNETHVASYENEKVLVRIQNALTLVRKVSVSIPSLFKWSSPLAKFDASHAIAEDIHNSIRSRYSLSDWENAAQPLHNKLRMQQRDALVAFLLVHPSLAPYDIVDADTLFEFFLIDVQMGACLQTSRLKQAISSVQQFVQRCILGLEEGKYPIVKNDLLDQSRWASISKQTIWTANKKVFMFAETYLTPSLRDDKTDLYLSLEAELTQKDVNPQSVQDSVKNYLFGLDQQANLLVEGIYDDDKDSSNRTIHFVARTRRSPYLYFHRTYSMTDETWTQWQSMSVDIPSYHVDPLVLTPPKPKNSTATNTITEEENAANPPPADTNTTDDAALKTTAAATPPPTLPAADGSYVIPFVLGKRLLVFWGQLMPVSVDKTPPQHTKLAQPGSDVKDIMRLKTWEIKIGWSEQKNGKWSNKQISTESIIETAKDVVAPPLDMYQFVPYKKSEKLPGNVNVDWLLLVVYNHSGIAIGAFEFHGSDIVKSKKDAKLPKLKWDFRTSFHMVMSPRDKAKWTEAIVPPTIYSLQAPTVTSTKFDPTKRSNVEYPLNKLSSTVYLVNGTDDKKEEFYHAFSHALLSTVNQADTLVPFFATLQQQYRANKKSFGSTGTNTTTSYTSFNELSQPYSVCNWEMGFHAPMELADTLFQGQNYDAALDMMHIVFNPYANGTNLNRVWSWLPFAEVDTASLLDALFNKLQPHKPDAVNGPINEWRKNPFMPFVVARSRPVAYMKWVVLEYLQILVAYGDWYFRQDSLEAVPMALQLYVLASHIYGPKAQRIPPRGKVQPQTYYSLLDKWDAISNAVVQLELQFPFSNQTPHPVEFLGNELVLANVYGFATTHYFSIPPNPQLQQIRDLIDSRIYNIRHCLDIDGNPISYPLWDPPIDPAALIAATAQGLSISSFLNDLNSPMPNYRFRYLLQNALDLCAELRVASDQFLCIKEKRDTEALSLLKAKQDTNMQALVLKVRNLQLDEANKALDHLRESRNAPLNKYKHNSSLAGKGYDASLKDTDSSFKEIDLLIQIPSTVGDLALSIEEKLQQEEAMLAKEINSIISPIESIAGTLFSLPMLTEDVQPWGCGAGLDWGPKNFADATATAARIMHILTAGHGHSSTTAKTKSKSKKQQQQRVLAANQAGHELV